MSLTVKFQPSLCIEAYAQLDSVILNLLARLIVIFYLLSCRNVHISTGLQLFTVETERDKKELKKYQLDRIDVRSKC